MSYPVHQIDIRRVLREKAPGKHVPEFVINYLERIAHLKELNAFMATHTETIDMPLTREYIAEGLHCTGELIGAENIPEGGSPLLFASNHPLGGLDGIILATLLGAKRNDHLRVIVNDLLMNIKPIAGIFVPVNKVGGQNRAYAERQAELWQSDFDIMTFPAGACSRKHKMFDPKLRSVYDLEWKHSFIRHAVQTRRDVVPVFFDAMNSRFFYNLAYWRKLLGIKLNIEMLYLADEMYRMQGTHFRAYVGKPIPYTTFDNSRSPQQWAQYVKQQVYGLHETHHPSR